MPKKSSFSNGWWERCRRNLVLYSLAVGAIVATGGVLSQWDAWGWPRPAMASELEKLEGFGKATRVIALEANQLILDQQIIETQLNLLMLREDGRLSPALERLLTTQLHGLQNSKRNVDLHIEQIQREVMR